MRSGSQARAKAAFSHRVSGGRALHALITTLAAAGLRRTLLPQTFHRFAVFLRPFCQLRRQRDQSSTQQQAPNALPKIESHPIPLLHFPSTWLSGYGAVLPSKRSRARRPHFGGVEMQKAVFRTLGARS